MISYRIFMGLIFVILIGGSNLLNASVKTAWDALQRLDIQKARADFNAELTKHPNDPEVLRGYLLASYFDLDDSAQMATVNRLVAQAHDDPYLLPIFEHVGAELNGDYQQLQAEKLIGEALLGYGNPMMQYCGRWMLNGVSLRRNFYADSTLLNGEICPGAWVCGPFDNASNISMFRRLPFEGAPLDTLATGRGCLGSLISWDYLSSEYDGLSMPRAFEDESDGAGQLRAFFELPSPMEVVVLQHGYFSIRLLIDGVEVFSDPTLRNSYIRGGVRAYLAAGVHEVTAIVGSPKASSYNLEILSSRFTPIPGLQWHRFASVNRPDTVLASVVHPIFDSFDGAIVAGRKAPDARFWKAVLQLDNGYEKEAIRELEHLDQADSLTPLERFALCKALAKNSEKAEYGKQLRKLNETTSAPLIALEWINENEADYAAIIKANSELDKVYPHRPLIEMSALAEHLLNGDIADYITALKDFKERYPWLCMPSLLLSTLYVKYLNNYQSAYDEFREYCEKSGSGSYRVTYESWYLAGLGKDEEAIQAAQRACHLGAFSDAMLRNYLAVLLKKQRQKELLPKLDSLIDEHPGNIELYDVKRQILQSSDDIEGANDQLKYIHLIKPAARMPYEILDSLRHGCSLDSIFGTPDINDLWSTEPSDTQKGDASTWIYLDRQQTLLFQDGIYCTDYHSVTVLLNQDAVENTQETDIGFEENDSNNKLVIARRLRKNAPPVEAQRQDEKLFFQDLKPGDAIELRYRVWRANAGDLYKDFWQTYRVGTSKYQRRWEYSILTDRPDLQWQIAGPAPAPKTDRYCGFQRLRFSGENVPAYSVNLALIPPLESVLGKIYVTTLANWQTLRDWYHSISQAVLDENPRAAAWADKLGVGGKSKRELVQDAYSRVVLDIPYQTLNFNYDASIPHRPDDVILNSWGDCKDKSHLLIAMLRRLDIPAWPVLVMTRDEGQLMPIPQFTFDHEIVGCVIDADTIFIDPSSSPTSFDHSLTATVAGQPCLEIVGEGPAVLRELPPPAVTDWWSNRSLELNPVGEQLEFIYDEVFYNISAADRREGHSGRTDDAYRRDLESTLSKYWETDVVIDSMKHDSLPSTSERFEEKVFGRMPAHVQQIGASRIITLPNLSVFDRSYPSDVTPSKTSLVSIPVDLRSIVGRSERSIAMHIPPEWGNPQISEPATIDADGGIGRFKCSWDEDARMLRFDYQIDISDGQFERKQFAEFIRKVTNLFTTPVLLREP